MFLGRMPTREACLIGHVIVPWIKVAARYDRLISAFALGGLAASFFPLLHLRLDSRSHR